MPQFRYSTNIIIPVSSSVKDDSTRLEINQCFDGLRALATRLDEVTGALSDLESQWPDIEPNQSFLGNNLFKIYAQADVDITYGMMVNFHNATASTVKAKPAQADSAANIAAGFYIYDAGVAAGEWGEFICGPGINIGLSGLTPGTWYYTSPSSAGLITSTNPTTVGQVRQRVGIALTDTDLLVGALNQWTQL